MKKRNFTIAMGLLPLAAPHALAHGDAHKKPAAIKKAFRDLARALADLAPPTTMLGCVRRLKNS